MLALDGLNLYAYCANDLVDYYDPSGYSCKKNIYSTSIDDKVTKIDKIKLPDSLAETNEVWCCFEGLGDQILLPRNWPLEWIDNIRCVPAR